MSINRTLPAEPKSMVAVARGPTPSTDMTVPRPYLSWTTLSPATSCSSLFFFRPPADPTPGPTPAPPAPPERPKPPPPEPEPAPYPDRDDDPKPERPEPRPNAAPPPHDVAGSSRSHSTSSSGISPRNRDGGLFCGEPHDDRVCAREM